MLDTIKRLEVNATGVIVVILDLRILSGIYPQIVSNSPKVPRAPRSLYVGGAFEGPIEVTKNNATCPKAETVYKTTFLITTPI